MGIGDFGCGVDNAIYDCKWVLFKIEDLGDFARDLALVLERERERVEEIGVEGEEVLR